MTMVGQASRLSKTAAQAGACPPFLSSHNEYVTKFMKWHTWEPHPSFRFQNREKQFFHIF